MAVADQGSVFAGLGDAAEGSLDADHRLLLRSSLPLLKSRNSGVVLAVCSLHHNCGTQSDTTVQHHGTLAFLFLFCTDFSFFSFFVSLFFLLPWQGQEQ